MSDQIDKLGQDINKINNKLDKMIDHQHNIDKTLVRQEVNIKEHIRRTDLLEKRVQQVDTEAQPAIKYVNGLKFIGKSIIFISVCVGTVIGVIKLTDL